MRDSTYAPPPPTMLPFFYKHFKFLKFPTLPIFLIFLISFINIFSLLPLLYSSSHRFILTYTSFRIALSSPLRSLYSSPMFPVVPFFLNPFHLAHLIIFPHSHISIPHSISLYNFPKVLFHSNFVFSSSLFN